MEAQRQIVIEACVRARFMPISMEVWTAEDRPPREACSRHIEESDAVLLVVGHRYGTLVPGEQRSYTEFEFDEALRLQKPVLAFVATKVSVDPNTLNPNDVERMAAFRERLAGSLFGHFDSSDKLQTLVYQALIEWKSKKMEGAEARTESTGEAAEGAKSSLILRGDAEVGPSKTEDTAQIETELEIVFEKERDPFLHTYTVGNDTFRLYRIEVRNTGAASAEEVQVRLTRIAPPKLSSLPVPLHLMHDNPRDETLWKTAFRLRRTSSGQFVDVASKGLRQTVIDIWHTVRGMPRGVPSDQAYEIQISASASNAPEQVRQFVLKLDSRGQLLMEAY